MLKTLSNFKPLLQSDYGKDMDCSLTSITACIFYYADDITYDFKDADMKCKNIYNNIVTLAENCCYNGDTYGMIPFLSKKFIIGDYQFLIQMDTRERNQHI